MKGIQAGIAWVLIKAFLEGVCSGLLSSNVTLPMLAPARLTGKQVLWAGTCWEAMRARFVQRVSLDGWRHPVASMSTSH